LDNKENVKHQSDYKKYLIITKKATEQGEKVEAVNFNHEAIEAARKRFGKFCLMSSNEGNALEVLRIYRDREVVESHFDDLKNTLDSNRFRVHTSQAMKSRIFLQFLALILTNYIRKKVREVAELKHFSMRELVKKLETLRKITVGERSFVVESSAVQRRILDTFDIPIPR
jgi:transposase